MESTEENGTASPGENNQLLIDAGLVNAPRKRGRPRKTETIAGIPRGETRFQFELYDPDNSLRDLWQSAMDRAALIIEKRVAELQKQFPDVPIRLDEKICESFLEHNPNP